MIPAAPESTGALDAYDALCEAVRSCGQCGDATTKQEGALCLVCVEDDADANEAHERAHMPGRI